MKTSANGIAFIAAHEGVVTRAYKDSVGVWTIGVGHANTSGQLPHVVPGMMITRQEAMDILARDLPRYERRTEKALPGVAQTVFDGATSFDFNTGAIDRASWVSIFRSGALGAARKSLMSWVKGGGRVIPGLVTRREAEADLIFDGKYGKAAIALAANDGSFKPQIAPSSSVPGAYDARLAVLGYASVIAYQQAHPDLVPDGVVGPATRAQVERDEAARAKLKGLAGGAVVVPVAAAAGIPVWMIVVGVAALLAVAGLIVWQHRDELSRMFKPKG